MDTLTALIQHIRQNSEDMKELRKELSDIQITLALEQNANHQRFANIARETELIKAGMNREVEFTFTHLRKVPLIQAAFAIGAMIGALRLPEESANVLIGVAKLLIGG